MTTPAHQLTDHHVEMINTHNPDLLDRYVATDYTDHNVLAADGREAARQFWSAFFTGLPDVRVTREDLIVARRPPGLSPMEKAITVYDVCEDPSRCCPDLIRPGAERRRAPRATEDIRGVRI